MITRSHPKPEQGDSTPGHPPSERLKPLERSLYGVGNMANLTTGYGVTQLINPVFNLGLGLNPGWIGLAQTAPRLLDIITDPLAGYLCDRLKPRFGRRIFVGFGAIFSAVSFALIWLFPSGLTHAQYFCWLLIFLSLTYLGWSLLAVPWQALGFELTDDYHERTRLMAVSTLFGGVAGVVYGWAFAGARLPCFDNTVEGARWVGGGLALFILFCGITCAIFLRERQRGDLPSMAPPQEVRHGPSAFLREAQGAFCSRPFRIMAGVVACMCIGVFSLSTISPYIAIYYIHNGDQTRGAFLVGLASMVWQGTSIVLAAPMSWVSRRIGKAATLLVFLGLALIGNALKWEFYNPTHPYLYVLPAMTFASGFTALWTLTQSMMADICDEDEWRTGHSSRGMFAALYMWTIKLGSTLAFAACGYLLNFTGFDAARGAMQGSATLLNMRITDFLLPTVTILIAMGLVTRYPLNERKMTEIRAALEARRMAQAGRDFHDTATHSS